MINRPYTVTRSRSSRRMASFCSIYDLPIPTDCIGYKNFKLTLQTHHSRGHEGCLGCPGNLEISPKALIERPQMNDC